MKKLIFSALIVALFSVSSFATETKQTYENFQKVEDSKPKETEMLIVCISGNLRCNAIGGACGESLEEALANWEELQDIICKKEPEDQEPDIWF